MKSPHELAADAIDLGLVAEVVRAKNRASVRVGDRPVWIDTPEDLAWLMVDLTAGPTNPEWRHERRGAR